MSENLTFKRFVYTALYSLSVHQIYRCFRPSVGAIFTFHRVLPNVPSASSKPFCPTRDLAITPEVLRDVIEVIQNSGYEIVSLSEAMDRLGGRCQSRRFACLTFDDGYRDNYEIAWPICAEYNAPITVYITTGLIEGSPAIWWPGLEVLIDKNSSIMFDLDGIEYFYRAATSSEKIVAYASISDIFHKLSWKRRVDLASKLGEIYSLDFGLLVRKQAMSWEALAEFAAHPNVEIGAHTVSHPALRNLSSEGARREIEESRRLLETRLKRPIVHFAYPHGDPKTTSEREFEICREVGFQSGTTTHHSPLTIAHKDARHNLPRLPVESLDCRRTVAVKLSGLSAALKHFSRERDLIQY